MNRDARRTTQSTCLPNLNSWCPRQYLLNATRPSSQFRTIHNCHSHRALSYLVYLCTLCRTPHDNLTQRGRWGFKIVVSCHITTRRNNLPQPFVAYCRHLYRVSTRCGNRQLIVASLVREGLLLRSLNCYARSTDRSRRLFLHDLTP